MENTNNLQITRYKEILRKYFSPEEIRQLQSKSDWKGTWEVLSNWFWIAAAMALAGIWPNIATIITALFILGGKQLGCAIIMHDASHFSLFKKRSANELLGNWLGAYPIIQNVGQYRPYHFAHHIATGTSEDPDINLTKGYPTTRKSLFRKFLRDLTGLSGLKAQYGVMLMHLGILHYNLGNTIEKNKEITIRKIISNGWANLRGPVCFHIIFFGILWWTGKPWLYLLWWGAILTTYNFCLRVRSIAEHSVTEDSTDPWRNTRTTYANFLEKILFAPLHVNYHVEHHLLINAPSYNYPTMHRLLKERGFYDKGLLQTGYKEIIQLAVKK